MKYFAIDLGIGMQLINIIRDIKEDAENKRVYIPVNLIGQVDPDDVLNNQQVIEKIDNENIIPVKNTIHNIKDIYVFGIDQFYYINTNNDLYDHF